MKSNKRKTIGVILESAVNEYANHVCQGLIKAAYDKGFDLLIFSSISRYGNNNQHYMGEKKIYDLPCYEDLDGVVVLPDTLLLEETKNLVLDKIRNLCHCPVISLREKIDGADNLLVDNKTCMKPMIEHFIDSHHFTKLCFMTGQKDRWYAQERLNCFLDIMKERNLPVNEHSIFYGDFWKNMGKEACDWFLTEDDIPDAIICANDYMACAVVRELILRGYNVPQDICVSGYDGLDEALNFTPSISSISVPFKEMGMKAIEIIAKRLESGGTPQDHYMSVNLELRESCSCYESKDNLITLSRANWHLNLSKQNNRTYQFNMLSIQLGECNLIEDLSIPLSLYIGNIENYKDYCMCFCENTFEIKHNTEFTDKMELRVAFLNGKNQGALNIPFKKSELIPAIAIDDEPQAWYLAPLHFEDRIFGYEAFQFNHYDFETTGQLFPTWSILLGNKLQHMSSHYENQQLIHKLEDLYNRDALTGMYNRRGLLCFAPSIVKRAFNSQKPIFLAIIDMDGLKQINDHFGHIEGDHALNILCRAIQDNTPETAINARTGGDEFVVLLENDDVKQGATVLAKIQNELEQINENHLHPYQIYASMGSVCHIPLLDDTVDTFICESDVIMYRNKTINKRRRGEIPR